MRHVVHLLLVPMLFFPKAPREMPATGELAQAASQSQVNEGRVRIATYNVENWRTHFESFRTRGQRVADGVAREQRDQERFQNDEDNWEIAQVFRDPAFDPDIVVIQEGPAQEELEEFNHRWLGETYETIIVFPSNDDRGQTIGIMLKPGFTVMAREDEYHQLPDTQDVNPRTDRLFARGPSFVLVRTPAGQRLWVGTNHQKSKGGGNDVAMTRWRHAEARATQQIMKQLAGRGPEGVVFLGDMNDELGIQSYELEGGGDVVAALLGPAGDGLVLATGPLAESGQASFMGYWNDQFRSLIDHIVVTPELAGAVRQTAVYDSAWARVASDHLPVYVDLELGGAN